MNLSLWGIRNPVPVVFVCMVLALWGLWAYPRLPVQSFPDLDVPTIVVRVALDGGSVDLMERDVAEPLEAALRGVEGIDRVEATVAAGYVALTVAFEVGMDGRDAESDVRAAVATARSDLPAAAEEPSISRLTFPATVLEYAISSPHGLRAATALVDGDLAPALRQTPGVASVSRTGGVGDRLVVAFEPAALAGAGLDVAGAARQLDALVSAVGGGSVELAGTDTAVSVENAGLTLTALQHASLDGQGGPVPLAALARIAVEPEPPTSMARLDGAPVVLVSILRAQDASDGEVAADARATLATVLDRHPGAQATLLRDEAADTTENHSVSMAMLYEGALIAVVVVFLFLRDWRATVVAATALPLSILPTFAAMDLLGFTLNTVSLLALSLVVGVLVDDAIVEVENAERHLAMGKDPTTAAGDAATEIGLAVIATTLTLVAVFLPTAFMPGVPGLIFQQFGVTAAVAVLFSLLVARLVTPVMAARMLRAKPAPAHQGPGRLGRAYLRTVAWTLHHPWKTMGAGALVVAGGVALATQIPTGFFPPQASDRLTISVTAPSGTSLTAMESHLDRVEEAMAPALAGSAQILSTIGVAQTTGGPGGGGGDSSASSGSLIGIFEGDLPSEASRAAAAVAPTLPGLRVAAGRGGEGSQARWAFVGSDTAALEATAARFAAELRGVEGIGTVRADVDSQTAQVVARLRTAEAARLGVSVAAVAQVLRVATGKGLDTTPALVEGPGGQDLPLVPIVDGMDGASLARLGALPVASNTGWTRLDAVADLSLEGVPIQIVRSDGARRATVVAELGDLELGEAIAAAEALPVLQNLPPGVALAPDGEGRQLAELLSGFATAMGIGILCIYGVLVLLFHGFVKPFAILVALPLSIGGALLPLAIFGMSFSMPALIGALLLMGIVTKNSILLVERAVENEEKRGMDPIAALVEACSTRARPVLMTTVAMVGGMIPVALSLHGGESSFRQPMGAVVIGGLLASTALSLLFVPAFSLVLDRIAAQASALPRRALQRVQGLRRAL